MKKMNVLAKQLTNQLLNRNIISAESFDEHYFGFQVLLANMIPLMIAVAFGMLLHCLPEVILFILFFTPPRLLAGGYHAKKFSTCLGLFVFTETLFILSLQLVPFMNRPIILLIGVSMPILVCLASAIKTSIGNQQTKDQTRNIRNQSCFVIYTIGISLILVMAVFSRIDFKLVYSACAGLFLASITCLVKQIPMKGVK